MRILGLQVIRRRGIWYALYLVFGVAVARAVIYAFTASPSGTRMPIYLCNRSKRVGYLVLSTVVIAVFIWTFGLWAGAIVSVGMIVAVGAWRGGRRAISQREMFARIQKLSNAQPAPKKTYAWLSWQSFRAPVAFKAVVEKHISVSGDLELITVDNSGRTYSRFGDTEWFQGQVDVGLIPTGASSVDIVLHDGMVLVRKQFRRNHTRFLQEWQALAMLSGKVNVPQLRHVDASKSAVYFDFVQGHLLTRTRKADGRRVSGINRPQSLPENFWRVMEANLNAMHRNLITWDANHGHIVVATNGDPWIVGFETAKFMPRAPNLWFALQRDRDRRAFNSAFGAHFLTERCARRKLAQIGESRWKETTVAPRSVLGPKTENSPWYAPLDLGLGLVAGPFWQTDTGMGRWEYLNCSAMPALSGKRILDLGSNNGVMPLMMLRSGAEHVIGLESSAEICKLARVVHDLFEWRDMTTYRFDLKNMDMRAMLTASWGEFDMITSFCSLYYLSDDHMKRIVRRAAAISPQMVIQANIDVSPCAPYGKRRKAGVVYLKRLLQDNGFPSVSVHTHSGFSRPLLVGTRGGES